MLVVLNDPESGPRRLQPWLAADGIRVNVWDPRRSPLPGTLDGFDGLVLLGGGLLPTEDDKAPWLAAERRLARQALDASLPTLGICLGEQLLAHVAGGHVHGDWPTPERGSTAIELTAAAHDDPLFSTLSTVPEPPRFVENHKDVVESLPADVVLLGRSERCPVQAFRIGTCAWGIQFHPEIDGAARTWDPARLRREGLDPEEVARVTVASEPDTQRHARQLVDAFAEAIAQASARR